jgi:hypothetical protein
MFSPRKSKRKPSRPLPDSCAARSCGTNARISSFKPADPCRVSGQKPTIVNPSAGVHEKPMILYRKIGTTDFTDFTDFEEVERKHPFTQRVGENPTHSFSEIS